MRFAIIVFPGSNCNEDLFWAIKNVLGQEAAFVHHDTHCLADFDAVLLPGGFSYGDYLRCGAIARFSPVMTKVVRFANEGKPVIGICNGFQILTEIGLLPGVLIKNNSLQFVCKVSSIKIENNQTIFTKNYQKNEIIHLPIAHGEGNYYCDPLTLEQLHENNQIVFSYEGENPNGSLGNIAGITNKYGNVLGMMPHPERAMEMCLGSKDGCKLFYSLIQSHQKAVMNLC